MIFTRLALLAFLVACASAFVPAPLTSKMSKSTQLQMVIGLPYKPVFSSEWGMDISESQKAATADAKAKIASALPADRVHIGYKDAKSNSVAIEVVSETFEGQSESARTAAVMGIVKEMPFSVDELYTVTFMEKFAQGMEKALPNTTVFDKKSVQAKGFDESKLADKLKEMSKETLSAVSPEIKPELEKLF